MAATAIILQLRTKKPRPIPNPSFLHFFSSSTSDPNIDDQTTTATSPPPPSQSSFSSYFSDVKASLKQQQQQYPQQRPPRKQFAPSNEKPPSKVASIEEIRKNLSEFRRRSAVPPPSSPPPPPSSQQISFQELYKQNVISKGEQPSNEPTKGGKISFDAIRESLRNMRPKNLTETGGKGNDKMSLSNFTNSFKLRPRDPNALESPVVIGGGANQLPLSVFGKEIGEKKLEQSDSMKTEFIRIYSYEELGEKLRKLRPETKGDAGFSLGELNDRLMMLRELEQRENESRISGVLYRDIRESLVKMQISEDDKAKKSIIQRLDILSQLGGTPNFMLSPPKENLVEVYFHPDNMSSADKMKLELKKVRDEFGMSETDCGSARVQVAQLTTKIKHLSTALHKKDKHSQKGLKGMVERRKKLLTYLRRTDWDSYCLVLSKLGLRDNTETKRDKYKNLNEKKGKNKKKKKKNKIKN